MRVATWWVVLALAASSPAWASPKKDVKAARAALEDGKPAAAVETLNQTLNVPGMVKPKFRAQAYLVRAAALVKLSADPNLSEEELTALQANGGMMRAADDLISARELDEAKTRDEVAAASERLRNQLLYVTTSFMSEGLSRSGEGRRAAHQVALQHAEKAAALDSDDYLSRDLVGQLRMELAGGIANGTQESLAPAVEDFKRAIRLYELRPPKDPDLNIGYAAYRLALVYRFQHEDVDEALTWLGRGQRLVGSVWSAWEGRKGDLDPKVWAQLEAAHAQVSDALRKAELDILLHDRKRAKEAITKFEAALKEEPKNVTMWLGLGQLLERENPARSIEAYETAHKLAPDNAVPPFNLGAVYNNRATAYFMRGNEMEDFKASEAERNKGLEELKKAVIWFEKAYALDNREKYVIQALMQAYILLEREDDYVRMKARMKEIEGG